jgi:quercetin dioxygenase-like cupin family protein
VKAASDGVELFQLDSVKTHYHPKGNHFLYILKGRAKGQIGSVTAEVGPGDLVVIPAGKAHQHKLEKIGDEPVVFLLFSTPSFREKDIVWAEK